MLIDCPECQKKISDKSEFCPNCGCPSSEFNINADEQTIKDDCPVCRNIDFIKDDKKGIIICTKCGYCKTIDENKLSEYVKEFRATQPDTRHKCPTCGSINIRKISATKKAGSILGFGILSNNIGKTFECLNPKCKYKW